MANEIFKPPVEGGMAWVLYRRFMIILEEYSLTADDFSVPIYFGDREITINTFTRRREHLSSLGADMTRMDYFLMALHEVAHPKIGTRVHKQHRFELMVKVSPDNEYAGHIQIFRNSEDEYKY